MPRFTAPIALCFALALPALCSAANYTVTDLGTLGGTSSRGHGINASGQVTGEAGNDAFLWTPTTPNGTTGTMQGLGSLGGSASGGYGISDNGQVTGYSWTAGDAESHAFRYDGMMHDLGTLDGDSSEGRGINDSSQVTGVSAPSNAFLHDGTMHDLGTLGGDYSFGHAINAAGQMTGYAALTAGSFDDHAFLYDGTMHDLGTLGGSWSRGYGINASGFVVGQSMDSENNSHAFLYDGTMHDLHNDPQTWSAAFAINSSGHVTGSVGHDNRAFLYTSDTGMVNLNTLIDPLSGWVLIRGTGINDSGQITGYGAIGGETHAFLLTPVPEPSTFVLAAICGVAAVGAARMNVRRRI